jgi:pyruvate,orthophosphate dikinase
MAARLGIPVKAVAAKADFLSEFNPMLGHRGCRLGITYPEITAMQARAIFEAVVKCRKKKIKVSPEIMVPLVGTAQEFNDQKAIIDAVAQEVMKKAKVKFKYMVGTMIEVPRAALAADEIAQEAEFFSFGTNDLTQMTFGYSRDDAGTFLPEYVQKKILPDDPFQTIDQGGVGELMELGVKRGRSTRKDLKIGICGEHGGEPSSVVFCHRIGLDYVSCSPFRVPIARLAAAHAALADKKKK